MAGSRLPATEGRQHEKESEGNPGVDRSPHEKGPIPRRSGNRPLRWRRLRGAALHRDAEGVDLATAILTVRDTKFYKSRLVPVGPQLADALKTYAVLRANRPMPEGSDSAFLANRDGTPVAKGTVHCAFPRRRRPGATRRRYRRARLARGGLAAGFKALLVLASPEIREFQPAQRLGGQVVDVVRHLFEDLS